MCTLYISTGYTKPGAAIHLGLQIAQSERDSYTLSPEVSVICNWSPRVLCLADEFLGPENLSFRNDRLVYNQKLEVAISSAKYGQALFS